MDANIWKDAATQMFFTLSLGFGALIAFASYMPIHNQVMRDAYMVVFVNCGTSLFAGIVVFSILGYRELKTGIPADKVCVCQPFCMVYARCFLFLLLSSDVFILSGSDMSTI